MKQFFKMVFANVIGLFITGVLAMVIGVGIIGAIVGSATNDEEVKIKENTILKLNFKNGVIDQSQGNFFDNFDFENMKEVKVLTLKKVLDNIEKAKTDDNIKGIYISLKGVNMNLANMDEIRKAIVDFRSSGKFTMAYGETIGQGSYYLASACEQVYLFPEGDLMFKGLASNVAFMKGALEKLDVEMQIIRGSNNKFKSAVEPFLYDKMSDANRKQTTKLLNSIWGVWVENIADSRGMTTKEVNKIADSVRTYDPKQAVESGMIDGLKYGDEILAELMAKVDVENEDDIEMIGLNKYIKASSKKNDNGNTNSWEIKNKIAVIYAAGNIVSGKSNKENMGSQTIAEAIKKARKDSSIKAIVLRVNSPGGSALASDVMWRETQLAKQAKPLVASMGGVAASGGYYIACGADRIFAGENTITGSIGVFGMIPYMGEFFRNKLGVTFDGAKTNANADVGTLTTKLTPYQYGKIQEGVDKIYGTFLSHVSEGRGLTVSEVDSIGQGRVWTGKDALEIGLVDEIGGLNSAVAYAAKIANLEEGDYRLKDFPERNIEPFEQIFESFANASVDQIIAWKFGEEYSYYNYVKQIANRDVIQASMPYELIIE